jgi:hypothetical protein
MKKTSGLVFLCGWIAIVAMVVGCTTAKPVAEWRDDSYQGGPFNNVLIIGVSGQEAIRRTFEKTFVNRLREEQVNAVAGFEATLGEARPTKDSIKAAIKEKNIDAVLVTHLIGVDEKQIYHPPTYSGSVYGYYGFVRGYAYDPGYVSQQKTVKLETNLYDASSETLVWSMQSATINPSSEKKLIEAKIKTVVERLKAQQLLASEAMQ